MTDDLPRPVTDALATANALDTDAFLDLFRPNGFVDDWGRRFTGRDAIRGWSDAEFIGKNVTLQVTSGSTSGSVTTVIAQVGGDGFNGPSTFTFDGDGDGDGDGLRSMTIRA